LTPSLDAVSSSLQAQGAEAEPATIAEDSLQFGEEDEVRPRVSKTCVHLDG
jgi:hypothetical protein